MNRFSHLHLKSQVRLLLLFTVAAIMIFGGLYYASIAETLKSKETQMIDNAHAQISAGVDRINSMSKSYCDYIAQNVYVRDMVKSAKDSERYEYNQTLYNILPVITSYNKSIDSVVFISGNGHEIAFNKKRVKIIDSIINDYTVTEPGATNNQLTASYRDLDGKDYYCYIKTIFDSGLGMRPEEKIGTCVIIMSTVGLADILPDYEGSGYTYYAVMDGSGAVIASNNKELDASGLPGGDTLTLSSRIGDSDWRLLSITPNENIYAGIRRLLLLGVLFLVFIAAGFTILLFQIQRTIIKPIEKIVEFTGEDKHGTRADGAAGIKEILYYMNNLSKEIKCVAHSLLDAQSRIYEIEISKHKAEYSALQSQINPHFLYNTLDCIKGHAIMGGNQEIVTITSSLSAIMRYCIKGSDFVPVKDEAACINRYIKIIDVRFEGRFRLTLNISDDILLLQMPRFLLQPIVENAVYHGLEPKYGGGEAVITGELTGGDILFEIYDNGCGISPDKLSEINSKLLLEASGEPEQEIGLMNINRRIKILFGSDYGIAIESAEGKFTRVRVRLPARINMLDVFIETG